jgi:glucan endo-1,3-alpha-glucosidase
MLLRAVMHIREFTHSLVCCLSAWLMFVATVPALASTPHYVFAHYMVCYSDYGATIQGFEQDIRDAQAAGVDGFALDMPEWNGPDGYYTNNCELMYEAAEQLGTGFKLFFSVEMTNSSSIVQMITTFAKRTNTFYYNGKLVISTYGQNSANWQTGVFQPLLTNSGINVFFVPYFIPPTMNLSGISSLLTNYSNILDGLYYYAAGTALTITNNNQAYIQACHTAGKLCMAGYSPAYWGCAQTTSGRVYVETQGGEGTAAEWSWIITNQPDWVELTTWNDFNESSYSSSITNPGQYEAQCQVPVRYSHAGYLALVKQYIAWYKTGVPPATNQDALFYFYRTHSTNAIASDTNDIPVTSFQGQVQDVIYTTAWLTSPASLVIASGNTLTTNSLPAGISNQRTSFAPGAQIFALQRSGKPVLSVQGPDVLAQITNYDYFTASGYAYGLPAPSNLSAQPQGGSN